VRVRSDWREIKPLPQPLPDEGGGEVGFGMGEFILGVISDGTIVDNKKQNELMQMVV